MNMNIKEVIVHLFLESPYGCKQSLSVVIFNELFIIYTGVKKVKQI